MTIKDDSEKVVRRISVKNKKGFNRAAWDLKYPSIQSIDSEKELPKKERSSFFAAPGIYTVTLSKEIDGITTELTEPKEFIVKQLFKGTLKGIDTDEKLAFYKEATGLEKQVSASTLKLKKAIKKNNAFELAVTKINRDFPTLKTKIHNLKQNYLSWMKRFMEIDQNMKSRKR